MIPNQSLPRLLSAATITAGLLAPALARADAISDFVALAGLTAGQRFQIAFLSRDILTPNATAIGTYDDFVANAANVAGLTSYGATAVTWQAIVSTATVNANDPGREPTTLTAPIYVLSGAKVAANALLLWSTRSTNLLNPINVDEYGVATGGRPTTGTNEEGFKSANDPSCCWLGTSRPVVGSGSSVDGSWIATDFGFSGQSGPLYAISAVLTVPGAASVPEPASMALLGAGLLGLGLARRFRAGGSAAA